MDDLYARLAKHLDRLPVGFPATESGVERRILQRWFTEEEARVALVMTGLPEPVTVIAARLGMTPPTLAPLLESMSRKGTVFRVVKGDMRLYNIVPMAEGMWEFHLHSTAPEELPEIREYMDHFMDKSWYSTPTTQHRVIPVAQSVRAGMTILPYERAEEIIRAQSKISLIQCICRKQAQMAGEGCDHPLETCMAFGTGAYFYMENGLGREASVEEALEVLDAAMRSGLVLQPGNGQKVWSICMCCECCCVLLRALQRMAKPARAAHSNFYAEGIPGMCTGCGLCEERCPMDAITVGETAQVNLDHCIGCGVCVGMCPVDAVRLHQKEAQQRYVPPVDVIDMQTRIARERGTRRV
jgi:Na+-translocating ferredoxin:NAD+ oxidoreductase subunit B